LSFFDHLSRQHNTCHLCTDHHKNIYYNEYTNLEAHFSLSHFICPYEICKAKCYVAFKTEDELRAHLEIDHRQGGKDKVKANALLGFQVGDDDEEEVGNSDSRGGRGRGGNRGRGGRGGKGSRFDANPIKDTEGVDFGFYFGPKYSMTLINRRRKFEERQRAQGDGGD